MKRADFTVTDQEIICMDSSVKHAFTFTPSISFFVECESETGFDRPWSAALAPT